MRPVHLLLSVHAAVFFVLLNPLSFANRLVSVSCPCFCLLPKKAQKGLFLSPALHLQSFFLQAATFRSWMEGKRCLTAFKRAVQDARGLHAAYRRMAGGADFLRCYLMRSGNKSSERWGPCCLQVYKFTKFDLQPSSLTVHVAGEHQPHRKHP